MIEPGRQPRGQPNHARHEEEDNTDTDALAHGPAIVGLTYRFADAQTEARYQAAIAPSGVRRLATLCWIALIVCVVRLGAAAAGLVTDPQFEPGLAPRCAQIALCLVTLVLLRRVRGPAMLELVGAGFGVTYVAGRCWLLLHMGPDGSAAMLVGTVTLLVFGLPVRLVLLTPTMAAASVLMAWIWSACTPPPSEAAVLQLVEWMAVVNLLGAAVLRMLRLVLRRQFALGQALRHLATHDGLTGIANRRCYDQFLARHWPRCAEAARPLSLVLLDVDFFKLLNDGIGHAAGDECLRDLARLLVRCVDDPASLVARTGGEEFACVLPGASPEDALKVAECITSALGAVEMPHPHSPIGPHITVSLGVATAYPAQGFTLRDLTGLADRLVYEAKGDGRACLRQRVLGRGAGRVLPVRAEISAGGWAEPL